MTRILCIDDNPAARYIFARVLRAAGYDVVEGGTAADAMRLVREERPDLLLLDVNLPDGNGRDVCLQIRGDAELAHTPVVLTSASSVAGGDRIRGLNCGADAYITEPTDSEELRAVINSLLRMSRAERTVATLNAQLERRVAELETLIETVPIGIALSRDPDCANLIINPPMAAMFGVEAGSTTSDALIGEGGAAILLADGRPVKASNHVMQAAAARAAVIRDREYEVRRNDGSTVHILGHAAPLEDERGQVAGVVGAFVDVTESRRQASWRRMLAEASMLLADTLDLGRTLDRAVEIAVKHMGDWASLDLATDGVLTRHCVVRREASKVIAVPEIRDEFPAGERSVVPYAALRTRQPQLVTDLPKAYAALSDEAVARLVIELGMRSQISVPLIAHGQALGVLSVVSCSRTYDEKDLSALTLLAERAALAVDNAKLFRAASDANRAKDDFLALVSHELRTPLTAISGWIELLHRDSGRDLLGQALGELSKSASSLRRLVEDLLDLSRINSGKLRVDSRPVDVNSIASDACDVARAAASAKSIGLNLTVDGPAYVLGDGVRIQQIASNLLTNAVKFTPVGGRVDVTVEPADETVTLRVSDTGRGIAAEFLPRVFDRFSQADPGGSAGLGLGLALVKQLTELHGGKVRVESGGIGKGASFFVVLPRIAEPVEKAAAKA